MSGAIVIVTMPHRMDRLDDCLSSLRNVSYPQYVVVNGDTLDARSGHWFFRTTNDWELGAIRHVFEQTDHDELFYLPDSCIVKDTAMFDFAFEDCRGKSVCVRSTFMSLLGKYRRDVWFCCPQWSPRTIAEACNVGDHLFPRSYTMHAKKGGGIAVLDPPLDDTGYLVTRWGGQRKRIENKWLIKWQSHFDQQSLFRTDH